MGCFFFPVHGGGKNIRSIYEYLDSMLLGAVLHHLRGLFLELALNFDFARSATGLLLLPEYICKGWKWVLRAENGRARAEVGPDTMGNVYQPSFEMCCVPL